MNITFINRMMGIKFGGGENFDLNMAHALKKRGHHIRFIIGREWKKLSLPMDENEFEVIYIKTPYLRDIHYKVKPTNILNKIISTGALELDLYLFENAVLNYLKNDSWTDIYQICGLPRIGALLGGQKSVTKQQFKTVVRWPGPPSKRKLKYMQKCDINFAHGNTMNKLRELIPKSYDIPAGVDLNKFKKYKLINNEKIKFVFLGRLIPVKKIDFLISAFNEAYRINKNIQLNIIGEGTELKSLKKLVFSDINFLGSLYEKKLYEKLGSSDVFCITSKYESFSMVVLEAMASYLPIIATNVGYLPNLVTNNGVLIELDNTEQLKNKILELASNKELREKMGQNGRERVEKEFSWDKSAEQLEKIYKGFMI